MWTLLLLVLATALLSSLFTLGLAAWLFETRIKPRLQAHVDEQVAEAIDALGATIEERVKAGVRAGVASLPSTEVLAGATRAAARTGVDIVGLGLASLLGGGRRRATEDPDPDED